MKRLLSLCLLLALCVVAQGQAYFTWTANQGDFYTGSNWDQNRIPGLNDVVIINNGGTATIAADAGDRALSSFELGELEDTDDSGHIVMNGGFLRIGESPGDSKIHIGEGDVQSSFIMNGGTIFFDGPDDPSKAGSRSSAGVNESDWEVGEHGVGRFEMHGDSVFRAGDDLKISENAAGQGAALIDGNARLSVGSGIAVSSGGTHVQELIIGGNAVVDSGNSMGAGSPDGHTDEGYLTLAIGGGNAKVVVQDSGTLNFRVLSSRQGNTEFTIKDNGQVHIFDVMAGTGGSAEDRPVQEGGFRSSLSSGAETESTLLLQDNAVMTVNAENGIGISGPRGAADAGGQAIMIVRDTASFRVEQYFALGTGTQSETSDGTLEIRGPDASVYIGENFNMAVDPEGVVPTTDATNEDGSPVPGKSTLSAMITSASHGTVEVGGIARIAQGILKVSLEGYTPVGGETFTLIQGGTIEGEFRETDFSGAQLADGLSWEVQYLADKVMLNVLGESGNGGGDTGGGTPATTLALSGDIPAMLEAGRVVDDTIVFNVDENNLDNWEPFSSVIGNSVFVVEANTFADDGTFSNQNYSLALQPVGGGAHAEVAGFYGDDGTPYTGQINGSRQNGNPGRVAGDRRPGATTYVVGGEASPHLYSAFQSDNRWQLGFDRLEDGRYGAVQMFSLDTTSLTPTPLSPAIDAVNGRLDAGEAAGNQIGRFGGDVAVLDNGNIVVAVDDRSGVREAGNLTTAVILAPDGSVVKESWVVDPRDIWSNVTSYKGGFAIRVHEMIYFHDNEGNETGQVNIVEDVPEAIRTDVAKFDTGRGDATRLTGHINSPYIFLAGNMGLLADDGFQAEDENFLPVNIVRIAAFDSRATGSDSYAGTVVVNELNEDLGGSDASNFLPALNRVNLASDALDRIAVAYEGTLRDEFGDSLGLPQTFVRVFSFDAGNGFEALTPSFFAFMNQNDIDVRTFRPTVAMTTTEILIAAKGEISSDNNPENGPDTPTQTTFYTVFAHPAPAADPTPSVDGGSSGGGTTELTISANGTQLTIAWDGGGSLFSASSPKGPWTAVNGASSPHSVTASGAAQYYRVGQAGQTVSVVLSGSQEVPAVASGGTGSGTLTVNGTLLTVNIHYSGLGSNFAAAHIHGPAARGTNAGVLVPLSTAELHAPNGTHAGTFSGSVEISAETAAAILEGNAYVNIHTANNGGGEIRGQTMP